MHTYDLGKEYYAADGLVNMEKTGEGKFKLGRLQVERKYIKVGCTPEEQAKGQGEKFAFLTRVQDVTRKEPYLAQVGLVHGFSEDTDTWFEMAY